MSQVARCWVLSLARIEFRPDDTRVAVSAAGKAARWVRYVHFSDLGSANTGTTPVETSSLVATHEPRRMNLIPMRVMTAEWMDESSAQTQAAWDHSYR
jgi:hypothetical protein